ncbi:hypothetical protein QJS10_CPA02g00075 [Acorus calamus]|uniref:Uncharacterized protein n=1 Tax=Acorus calamus TaxID=4465 RepID=A0AAV9FCV6_ACOCL|nr:hypothetical protein QJS10_CPA02g00075 [Acorus calamus]
MASGRFIQQLLRRRLQSNSSNPPLLSSQIFKQEHDQAGSFGMRALALFGAGVTGILSFATITSADEAEHGLECPNYPWPHEGILSSYDHAS